MKHAPNGRRAAWRGAGLMLASAALTAHAGTYVSDFSSNPLDPAIPDDQKLIVYSTSENPAVPAVAWFPSGGNTDGGPTDGFLQLTAASNYQRSVIIFPDYESGFAVQSFVFEVDCKIGGGTATPADGMSINFARPEDPVIVNGGTGFAGRPPLYEGDPSPELNLPEEGTTTGLAIGFDAYDSDGDGPDYIGISVRLDGELVDEAAVPMPTLHGAANDISSLQTGPREAPEWVPLRVELTPDSKLYISYKGQTIVDGVDLSDRFTPFPGRLIFAARTGALNQLHQFDNLKLTTVQAPLASVSGARLTNSGFEFQVTDNTGSTVTPAGFLGLEIDGFQVSNGAVTLSKSGGVTTATYPIDETFLAGSSHTFVITFRDQNNRIITRSGTLSVPFLPDAPLVQEAPLLNRWIVREIRNQPRPEGDDALGIAVQNALQAAEQPGETPEDPFYTVTQETKYFNFSDPQNSPEKGLFRADQDILTNTGNDDNDLVSVGVIRLNIPEAGKRTFWVQSDDGFALRVRNASPTGPAPVFETVAGNGRIDPSNPSTIGYTAGTSNSNTRGVCVFPEPGEYIVDFLWFEASGGAFAEVAWTPGDFSFDPTLTGWTLVGGGDDTPYLVSEGLPLPTPTGNQWSVRHITHSANIGDFRARIALAENAAGTDGTSPVINFNDLNGGTGTVGFFNNDLPFVGDTPGDDNDFVTAARYSLTLSEPGLHTFAVWADDGYVLRVLPTGDAAAPYIHATAGNGGIDPLDGATFVDPAYHDSPGFAVYRFPSAGTFIVELVHQEGGGGASLELFHAAGDHRRLGSTSAWQLLGDAAANPQTPVLPATLPGPSGQAGLWGIRFFNAGGAVGGLAEALSRMDAQDSTFVDGAVPYLNMSDLYGEPGGQGLFKLSSGTPEYQVDELNFSDDGSVANDNLVAVAKARVVIPTSGDWTFGVHSDDGFALRVLGTTSVFQRVSGDSRIDPAQRNTVYFPNGTGDADARAVINLEAGEYDFEFVWFEGNGGAYFELYAAQGSFGADGDTTAWRLVGGPEGLELVAQSAPPAGEAPVITGLAYTPGAFAVTFTSEAGATYTVQYSADLANWVNAVTNLAPGGAQTTYTADLNSLNLAEPKTRVFFRVQRNP